MKTKQGVFENIYQTFSAWQSALQQGEGAKMIDWVEHAKQYMLAAESLPEEKIRQFISNLEYDLTDFYHQTQSESQHSLFLGLINESFWQTMQSITDKSQVEWSELIEDFEHQGSYQSGDFIGFGELECTHCQERALYTHAGEVIDCLKCNGKQFIRKPLAP